MGTGVTTSICLPEETQVTYSPTCACIFFNKQFVVNNDGIVSVPLRVNQFHVPSTEYSAQTENRYYKNSLTPKTYLLSYSNGKVSVTHTLERVAVAKQLLLWSLDQTE